MTDEPLFYNLTPHAIHVYATQDPSSTPIYTCPSSGALRLSSAPQPMLGYRGRVPIIGGQSFLGLEENGPGFDQWKNNPTGHFIVSLPTAQWLVAHPDVCGQRFIYCPATDPVRVVRSSTGEIRGTTAFERHVSSNK